jgi:hypothetical protein
VEFQVDGKGSVELDGGGSGEPLDLLALLDRVLRECPTRFFSSFLSFPEVIEVYRSCTSMSDSSFVVFCVGCCEQAIIHGSSLLLT